ncbi:hypothetical protein [Pseudonocardia sp. ICBG1034]|uniref:hypothetical protein n=1 Tax=Pseudonocardia sp. ICBG1034 TaxID=2844381 RepID=UPI001CD02547|nr:hypothetical protein [Pseudonocardia sp. ICBG1034]
MPDGEKVRASRDGDRFHYYWAARRALGLLDLTGSLEAISVEGPAEGETVEGEEVVDVAEYWGGSAMASCSEVRYAQLKHSTMRTAEPVVASELRTTLAKFAEIYRIALGDGHAGKLRFTFVTNRSLNDKVRCSLTELAAGTSTFTHPTQSKLLRGYMRFGGDRKHEIDFCRRLHMDDAGPGIVQTEALLDVELRQHLPSGTGTEMAQLVDAVARRATTLDARPLRRADVLLALRATEYELFPAPSRIEPPSHAIRTGDVDRVVDQLRHGRDNKLILTAVGGVGKSVLTTMLGPALPEGSELVVYDCFAGGDYRKITSQRHDHRTALTQICNELATRGRCLPLVPTDASETSYMRAFKLRIGRATEALAREQPGALLTIVIDAADNAALAAADHQQRTVVTDLLREDWPVNARLVQLCRPERLDLLDVPTTGVTRMALDGFGRPESLLHLRTRFPEATERDGDELHALSGGNPRVQAMALDKADSAAAALSSIRIAHTGPGEVLDSLLSEQIRGVADQGHLLKRELERLAEALATLHPVIPLEDLAAITEVSVDAIRSFAVALGRGLHTTESTVQFRDEPTETWFRTTYAPAPARLREFVADLMPLAARSSYLASNLPQLLFEAGMLVELVELVLSDSGLPGDTGEHQAREIARARARFALCATLHQGHNAEAALLAIKIGALSSGHSRRMATFRSHPDLAGRFLDPEIIDGLCSGREMATDWPGSNLHVEAALLSHVEHLKDLARNRRRSSFDNFVAILAMPEDEDRSLRRHVTPDAVADLALAAVNTDGPEAGVELLCRWQPDGFVHAATLVLAARLADARRDEDINGLVIAADGSPAVQMAVATTMFDHNVVPSADTTAALVAAVKARTEPFRWERTPVDHDLDLREIVWTLIHALRCGQLGGPDALRLLNIHLPKYLPDSAGGRLHGLSPVNLLLAHALRARLKGTPLTVDAIASGALVELMGREYSNDHNARDFRTNIPGLLPWVDCWVDALLAEEPQQVIDEFTALVDTDLKPVSGYNTPFVLVNATAEIAVRILALIPLVGPAARVAAWHEANNTALSRSAVAIARVAARSPQLENFCLDVVTRAVDAAQRDRTDADTRIDSLIGLARALLAANGTEARAIFDLALAEADRVGDDLYSRWYALTKIAKALATGEESARAYRLFQIGEELDRNGEIDIRALGKRLLVMHESTYFTALSRARDRRTLDFSAMVTPAAASGDQQVDLLAFEAFRPMTAWRTAVAGLNPVDEARATRVLDEFTRFERGPGEVPSEYDTGPVLPRRFTSETEIDPEERFAASDFTTSEAWDAALTVIGWRDEDRRALVRFAVSKHPTRRSLVLDAFSRAVRATESDFTLVAQTAATVQTQTPALRQARDRLASELTQRFASSIGTRYDDDRLVPFAEATGTTVAQLSSAALRWLGRTAHRLTYRDYFLLAANLATTLPPDEAGAVFDALAELFEDLAPSATSSDGSGDALPVPTGDHASGLAGVLWSALGDMSIAMRWRAAHAVLLLVRLGCIAELDALVRFADGTSSVAPFHDARFPFYLLHARLWLLLALSRAALDQDAIPVAAFAPWLKTVVLGPRHAANQFLAQRTLLTLADRGLVSLGESEHGALSRRVVAETVELDRAEQRSRPDPLSRDVDEEEAKRYPFFLDFEQYWCDGVAEAFGSTESNVARRALEVADELDETGAFAGGMDPRADVYAPRGSYPDRGDWPDEDNHAFYLAVHALLTVGAELAVDVPACHEPEDAVDTYSAWLAKFLPTRPDGRWLADRRDPPPSPAPERTLADFEPKEHWPWSLSLPDFDAAVGVGVGGEWICVDAYTTVAHAELSQDLRIRTALVPHPTARSLLIASQTSPLTPAGFPIPTTDDQFDRPDRYPYDLLPWLNCATARHGIDERDERGTGVRFPPTRPGDELIARFDLTADDDQRTWFHRGVPACRSTVWRDLTEHRGVRETGVEGARFEVSLKFVTTVLRELDRTLFLQVELRRDRQRPYRGPGREEDDDIRRLESSGKTYLLDPAGHWSEY